MLEPWGDDRLAANDRRIQENFSAWFGDSKIIDKSKLPLRLYHGTSADFSVFRTDSPNIELGAHFGTLDQCHIRMEGGDSPHIMPVYLSIKNPLRLIDEGNFHPETIQWQLKKRKIKSHCFNIENQRSIEAAGYDGIIYLNRREIAGLDDPYGDQTDCMSDRDVRKIWPQARDSYIIFHPHQVKSAIGNSGLYLCNSDSLTDQEADLMLRSALIAKNTIDKMAGKWVIGSGQPAGCAA